MKRPDDTDSRLPGKAVEAITKVHELAAAVQVN